MANHEDLVTQLREHQECWELLPWAVNGRLSSSDAVRISQHLQQCTRCSEELHVQHQLCEAIRADDPVLLAPQASLKKLWQRFDAPARPELVPDQASSVPVPPTPAPAAPRARGWQAAFIAQAAAIVVLLSSVVWQTQHRSQQQAQIVTLQEQLRDAVLQAPRFVTQSTPPAVVTRAPMVRIVFAPTASVRDIAELLHAVDAQVLDGPSPQGVFTLSLASGSPHTAARAAQLLEADKRVRFAAPVPEAP